MVQKLNTSQPIGIVGLGLIGGSIGLDLQNLGYKVHGLTKRSITAKKAQERGLAQIISTEPQVLRDCSIVIIALPIEQLLKPDKNLISQLPLNAVITDVGSVKEPILKVWQDLHPHFVASHLMAGTNETGVNAGKRNLFKGKAWVTTPEENTDPNAIKIVRELAIALGCEWITTSAHIHDQAVALISHLPLLISATLLKAIATEQNESILSLAKTLASSGFIDTTRIGGGNPQLGVSIAKNNTSSILPLLKSYKQSLESIEETIISGKWTSLEKELHKTQIFRSEFLN